MTQNQQKQQYDAAHHRIQEVKPFPWLSKGLNIFGIVFLVFCVVAIVICIWAVLHRDPKNPASNNLASILVTVIFPILGTVYSYIQVHLAVNSPHLAPAPSLRSPVIELPSPPGQAPYFRSLNSIPPATNSRMARQLEKTVKDICSLLNQRDLTAVVLTGIAGVGKSTLAALVYQHCLTMKSPFIFVRKLFITEPLWLEIKANSTFDELAAELFKYVGKALPVDFLNQDPDVKASTLISAMEQSRKAGLVILNQFDNWLEWKTGYALPDFPEVDAWLNAINSLKCKNQFLLTSRIRPRIRPRGTRMSAQACTKEFLFEKLEFGVAVELLRTGAVDGTDLELLKVVTLCDAHAGALAGLVSLLQEDEPSLDFHSTKCVPHWMKKINDVVFKSVFQQFDHYEQDLLFNFAVYRTSVPLQIALNTEAPISEETWDALNVLLKQHLFQKSKNDHYRLHPVVAHCTQHYLNQVNKHLLQLAHDQAYSYYQSLSWRPQGMRQRKEDIQYLLETIWHLFQAERERDAQDLMQKENIHADLLRWGDDLTILELQELLA